ncbi:hypothetical protein C8R44DRAFT_747882 [Mycena epipterygia]|nr:hypothetical protein C8R44DRAFT_747882 [Mycena epipterygia]
MSLRTATQREGRTTCSICNLGCSGDLGVEEVDLGALGSLAHRADDGEGRRLDSSHVRREGSAGMIIMSREMHTTGRRTDEDSTGLCLGVPNRPSEIWYCSGKKECTHFSANSKAVRFGGNGRQRQPALGRAELVHLVKIGHIVDERIDHVRADH